MHVSAQKRPPISPAGGWRRRQTQGGRRAQVAQAACRYAVKMTSDPRTTRILELVAEYMRDRRLRPGDEVIAVAAGFPTTVNPILQNGLVPVFVDVTLPEYNIDVTRLEEARSDRTRAVMVAHTLGNPFDLGAVSAFCERH